MEKFSIIIVAPVNCEYYKSDIIDSNMIFYFYSVYERNRFGQFLSENFKDLWIKIYSVDDVFPEEVISCRRKGRIKTYTDPGMAGRDLEIVYCNSSYALGIHILPEDRVNFYNKFLTWTIENNYKCYHFIPSIDRVVDEEKLGYPEFDRFYDLKKSSV